MITPRVSREAAVYGLAYALWLMTVLISILAVLQVRLAVSALSVINGADRYTVALIDQVSLILVSFVAFVYVMWLEHYYRDGVTIRIRPKLGDKIPPLPAGRIMRGLSERGLDILARRFAFSFAIPLVLFLLSLVGYQGALDALTALH